MDIVFDELPLDVRSGATWMKTMYSVSVEMTDVVVASLSSPLGRLDSRRFRANLLLLQKKSLFQPALDCLRLESS